MLHSRTAAIFIHWETMKAPGTSLQFTTESFCARRDLEQWVVVKTARLCRETTPNLDFLSIHLERKHSARYGGFFLARATAEHSGLSHLAYADGPDPESAVIAVTRKLGRALAAEARASKNRPDGNVRAVKLKEASLA
jgi:hypothetical protein